LFDSFPQFISNEGVIKVLSDIDNLSDEKLKDVASIFLKDFKDGNLEAHGWQPVVSAYAVSKTLVNAYSRLLAKRHPSLEVCCVNPGFVKTDMNYGIGLISVEEGANAPVRLALQEACSDSCLYFEQCEISEF
jgi:(+)-neomenthol dehydrogenase